MENGQERENALSLRVEKLMGTLERMRLDEYVEYVSNRKRLIWQNIAYGILRGFGFTIGFSVLGAVAAMILSSLAANNIPVIGDFLAEVVHAIEARL